VSAVSYKLIKERNMELLMSNIPCGPDHVTRPPEIQKAGKQNPL
jgi:hypothetical protein